MVNETLRALQATQGMAAIVALVVFFLSLTGAGMWERDLLGIIGLVFFTIATAAAIAIIAINPDTVLPIQSSPRT